ncbi:MAG: hypothetical protein WC390_10195 [Sulfurimonas sp.]
MIEISAQEFQQEKQMLHYKIEVVDIQKVCVEYIVTAESEAEALKKFNDGDIDEVSGEELLDVLEQGEPRISDSFA